MVRKLAVMAGVLILQFFSAVGVAQESGGSAEGSMGDLVIVLGAEGTPEYGRSFQDWSQRWQEAAVAGGVEVTLVGRADDASTSDRQRLEQVLASEVQSSQSPLWLVLIGHGTFDGRRANFNLRGEDVSANELAEWLQDCQRPLAVINCASASAPFIDRLAGTDRIVMTATKSGAEVNFARFGDYLSRAITDLSADLDKDSQVSLFEAFLRASRQTQSYYDGQRLLATERALLDDNGDARGVGADFFAGLQPTTQAEGGEALDGLRAHQWHLVPSEEERRLPVDMRRQRNDLELELARLRERKSELDEDAYYALIEPVLLEIAELYASVDNRPPPRQQDDDRAEPATDTSSSNHAPEGESEPPADDTPAATP